MELQWPLMIFTLFVCLGAGIFAYQGLLAFLGKGEKIQFPALLASLASIVIGGLGSFLHLEHWTRIFNGFGHLTSGITQELIGIVVFVVVLVIYFIMMKRSDDGNTPPKWCGIVAIVASLALVFVMGHSYNMAARPIWDTLLLPIYYITNAAFFGSLALIVLVDALKITDGSRKILATCALVGGVVQALATAAYAAVIASASTSYSDVGFYFDPTQPTKEMVDAGNALGSIFTGSEALLFWLGVVIVGLVLPLILAFLIRKAETTKSTLVLGVIAVIAALAGGMCLRAIFYILGFSVFLFY